MTYAQQQRQKSILTFEEIRQYWTEQAHKHGQSPSASWSDLPVIDLEMREMVKRLSDGDSVLDVGCGNGYSTIQYASAREIHVQGIDYVPEMITQANKRREIFDGKLQGKVEFAVGDILALKEPPAHYDKVVVTRVVINLGRWENQRMGLRECSRVVKSGGLLLLSEATLQGWEKLNCFRSEWNLPPIPMPSFNLYLDENDVIEALTQQMELVEICNFASTYYIGTRVLKPLLVQATGAQIEVANPDMEWNRWFAQFPAAGDYGTQKLFVFKKR